MNVKPGDLAYLVNAKGRCKVNIGAIVEVLEPKYIDENGDMHWLCRSSTPLMAARGDNRPLKPTLTGSCADKFLRRIAGPDVDISETTEKPIKKDQPIKEPA